MRELVRSYEVLARQKRAEETRPWEIIRVIDPAMLHSVLIIDAAMTRPIWLTDENAIRDLRSVWREHKIAERRTPNSENTTSGSARGVKESLMKMPIRKIP